MAFDEPRALLESVWNRIRGRLEEARHRIHEEIKNYPRPIPACDLQFNHLLEEQANLAQEMCRLHEAMQASRESSDPGKVLEEFIGSAHYLDNAEKERVKAVSGS